MNNILIKCSKIKYSKFPEGKGRRGLVKKVQRLRKKKTLIDTENSMMITRGKRREVKKDKGGINGDRKRLASGW